MQFSDSCVRDRLFIDVWNTGYEYKHCGNGTNKLEFFFDVSESGGTRLSFITDNDSNIYDGFMLEFIFQLMPFTQSAYNATIDAVEDFYDYYA